MVKVKARIIQDVRSRNGRIISAQITTDDEDINILINSPYIYRKTYPVNTTAEIVKKDMKSEIFSIISSAKGKLKDDDLAGRTIEMEV